MAGTVTSAEVQAQNKAALGMAVRNLNAVLKAGQIGTAEALAEIGIAVTAAIKLEVSHPGAGRVYFIRRSKAGNRYWSKTGPGIEHQASAPGDPPAVDTGKYRASWAWLAGKNALGPYVDVGTNAVQGPALEFGSKNMAARPHVRPVIHREMLAIRSKLAEAIVAKQMEAIASMRGQRL